MHFVTRTLLVLFVCSPALPADDTIPCILINGKAYVHASYLCGASRLQLDALRIIQHEPFVSIRSLSSQGDGVCGEWRLDTSGHSHVCVTGDCLANHARHEYYFKLYQACDYWRCEELWEQRPWLVERAQRSPAPHVNSLSAWPPTREALAEVKAYGGSSFGWAAVSTIFNNVIHEMEAYLQRHPGGR